jgi:hypothetical protein
MGELNLDKFERDSSRLAEPGVICSAGKQEIMARCSSTAQNEMSKPGRECSQCSSLTYIRYRKLHRHFVVV